MTYKRISKFLCSGLQLNYEVAKELNYKSISNSRFIIDPKSSHQIQNDDPEIVATSIQTVINAVTSKTKL